MTNKDNLSELRHSTAHLLAASVLELWPDTKLTIGPSIENGFYYDFDFGERSVSESDFQKIEKKMHEIVKKWEGFEKKEVTEKEAKEFYKDNPYKLELIDEIVKKGESITLYISGDFTDLCRGGHVDDPKELGHFKLLSVAGAYWRGSEKNKMLTRIYGTAFEAKDELNKHLEMLEEAKKRDHKKLGRDLDLFFFSDYVGPGLPLWTPKGTMLRTILDDYVWELRRAKGYEKVTIPHIAKKELYETSGHWDKFKDELFKITSREGHFFAMKPMQCPHHTQIYTHTPRSYKDLPQRYCETTMMYRDEQTGELSGLARVRSATQDDAHVFCRFSQIKNECLAVWDVIERFYKAVGFEELEIRLSLHDPANKSAYLGSEETWKKAEAQLRDLLIGRHAKYQEAIGEAAFYGPKIDFMAHDSLGRIWQVATIQLDFNQPEGFDLVCINEKGEKERIAMIHAAVMGSIERFLSILIEHYGGAFPLWLAPIQISVLPVSEKYTDLANMVGDFLKQAGVRVSVDYEDRPLGAKIRANTLQKVPFMIIMGEKEEAKSDPASKSSDKIYVSVRSRAGQDLGQLVLSDFISTLKSHIEKKTK